MMGVAADTEPTRTDHGTSTVPGVMLSTMTSAMEIRAAFNAAAGWYLRVIDSIETRQWDQPGLGVWDLRSLVAHSLRSFSTVDEYTSGPGTEPATIHSALGYYQAILQGDRATLHASVAKRGSDGAAKLGEDPSVVIHALVARVLDKLRALPDDRACVTPFGVLPLSAYLQTRLVELVVHGLDICRATGQTLDAPTDAARLALEPLIGFSDPQRVLLAITGRALYDLFA